MDGVSPVLIQVFISRKLRFVFNSSYFVPLCRFLIKDGLIFLFLTCQSFCLFVDFMIRQCFFSKKKSIKNFFHGALELLRNKRFLQVKLQIDQTPKKSEASSARVRVENWNSISIEITQVTSRKRKLNYSLTET